MDIEFHYYMTYLIAAKAGFTPDDAFIIAYSSQYVDDNDRAFEISTGEPSAYRNYVSQTMNILKPKDDLFRIYPLFHFIPGDPKAATAYRKDGKMHWLNTTPNSDNANAILQSALASRNLYRIGIAAHSYVDTWAHQNFVGYYDEFNAMKGDVFAASTPNVGHADAGHSPDQPALVWEDTRLLRPEVDNKARFLEAACCLFDKLARYRTPSLAESDLKDRREELRDDLDLAIGQSGTASTKPETRIQRYVALGMHGSYGNREIPIYDEHLWFGEAVNEDVKGLPDTQFSFLDPIKDELTWSDPDGYRNTHWHRFQEAVKDHQNFAWAILEHNTFARMDLPSL